MTEVLTLSRARWDVWRVTRGTYAGIAEHGDQPPLCVAHGMQFEDAQRRVALLRAAAYAHHDYCIKPAGWPREAA